MSSHTFPMLHKTVVRIDGFKEGSECVTFVCEDGAEFEMWHQQDCCESVYLADVIGDPKDLIGSPILRAEEVSSDPEPDLPEDIYRGDSYTWTFYKFATIKGEVVARWFGTSNGYYSEEARFRMTKATQADRMAHALGAIRLPEHLL